MIIGVWGFKQRQDLYSEIFPFKPVGFLLYLGFCTITLTLTAYVFSMGNDPISETLEDGIIYSQLGFGVLFFVYTLSNFSMLIQKNYKVAKIVYQSRVFPFFVFRIGGVLIFGYIFYSSGYFPYYQALAGYYNGVGDVYLIDGNYGLAEQYYNEASLYEFQNHRSNYGKATLARKESDRIDEFYFFENSLLKRPTEFAYVNLANAYQKNNQYFDGLFKLKEGGQVFPSSGHILNNLGYIYSRTDLTDSAFFFFNSAYYNSWQRSIPASNILALLSKSGISISTDSLEEHYKKYKTRNWIANNLASRERNNETNYPQYNFEFRPLSGNDDFALYYNAGLSKIKTSDTTYFKKLTAMTDTSGSNFYYARARMLLSLNEFFNHKVRRSFEGLDLLATSIQNNAGINMLLGYLSMDRGAFSKAIEYFDRIFIRNSPRLKFDLALCYLSVGTKEKARAIFNDLLESGDRDLSALSTEYLHMMDLDFELNFYEASDEVKYLMLFYRYPEIARDDLVLYMSAIENPSLKQLIQMHIASRYLNNGDEAFAQMIFENIQQNNKEELQGQYKQLAYRIASVSGSLEFSFENNEEVSSSHPLYLDRLLFEATRNQAQYTREELSGMFMTLGSWDPFYEIGIAKAMDFFTKEMGDDILGYNLVYNALSLNSKSILLGKKYVEQSILIGMNEYAIEGLNALKNKMSEVEYKLFEERILSIIEERERAFMELGF
jgi:Flp pilus assembly protein TadD